MNLAEFVAMIVMFLLIANAIVQGHCRAMSKLKRNHARKVEQHKKDIAFRDADIEMLRFQLLAAQDATIKCAEQAKSLREENAAWRASYENVHADLVRVHGEAQGFKKLFVGPPQIKN